MTIQNLFHVIWQHTCVLGLLFFFYFFVCIECMDNHMMGTMTPRLEFMRQFFTLILFTRTYIYLNVCNEFGFRICVSTQSLKQASDLIFFSFFLLSLYVRVYDLKSEVETYQANMYFFVEKIQQKERNTITNIYLLRIQPTM